MHDSGTLDYFGDEKPAAGSSLRSGRMVVDGLLGCTQWRTEEYSGVQWSPVEDRSQQLYLREQDSHFLVVHTV